MFKQLSGRMFTVLAILMSFACTEKVTVNEKDTVQVSVRQKDSLKVGIGAMISPGETIEYYSKLLRVIATELGRPLEVVQRKTYDEINELVHKNEVDFAWICPGPYVEGKEKFGMELVAVPVVSGKPQYFAYIIVRNDSPIRSLEGLRGKKFAFTDPISNTGHLVAQYELAKIKETEQGFFRETFYTYSHDNSIKAVGEGLADGATVDSLVWDYFYKKKSKDTLNTKIVKKIGPFGIQPIVVHPSKGAEFKKKLKSIFLSLHENPVAAALMTEIHVDRFIEGRDSSYQSIREMKLVLDRLQKEKKQ